MTLSTFLGDKSLIEAVQRSLLSWSNLTQGVVKAIDVQEPCGIWWIMV